MFSRKKSLAGASERSQEQKPGVKTSSLFKNNPEIPELPRYAQGAHLGNEGLVGSAFFRVDWSSCPILFVICRPEVKQVQEKVFSSDAFHELDLHPHLVSSSLRFRGSLVWCAYSFRRLKGQSRGTSQLRGVCSQLPV